MYSFADHYLSAQVPSGHVELFWLGQAGFLIKTASGKSIAIDPYLSEFVLRTLKDPGFKRINPPPFMPGEIDMDVLLISHEHGDHFDADSLEGFMKSGKTEVYANVTAYWEMEKMGADMRRVHRLEKGVPVDFEDFRLIPTDCDHGELAPEALGFLLDFGFTRVYYAGDTALTYDRLSFPISVKPEVAILPINGAFGNLDGIMAAEYAGRLECKICVPCHFWTFPLHHGDPQQIIDALPLKAPNCELRLLRQGEGFTI